MASLDLKNWENKEYEEKEAEIIRFIKLNFSLKKENIHYEKIIQLINYVVEEEKKEGNEPYSYVILVRRKNNIEATFNKIKKFGILKNIINEEI